MTPGSQSRSYTLYPYITSGCTCQHNDFDVDTNSGTTDDAAGAMVNGLPVLVPTSGDSGHYAGRATVSHYEEPRAGGSYVIDSFVEWDLSRR